MKQIRETNNKTTIVLEDGDTLEIIALKKNKDKLIVHCINSALHIDEVSLKEVEQLQNEKEAIRAMKKYLKEQDSD